MRNEKQKRPLLRFVIICRFVENGDYFEQQVKAPSASLAIKSWRKFWNSHESECAIFEVKKC